MDETCVSLSPEATHANGQAIIRSEVQRRISAEGRCAELRRVRAGVHGNVVLHQRFVKVYPFTTIHSRDASRVIIIDDSSTKM